MCNIADRVQLATDELVGLRLEREVSVSKRIRIAAWSDGVFVSTYPLPRFFQKLGKL